MAQFEFIFKYIIIGESPAWAAGPGFRLVCLETSCGTAPVDRWLANGFAKARRGVGQSLLSMSMNTSERGASMPAEFLAPGAGDMGVGKSCLLHQFTEKRFQEDQVRSPPSHSFLPLPSAARDKFDPG